MLKPVDNFIFNIKQRWCPAYNYNDQISDQYSVKSKHFINCFGHVVKMLKTAEIDFCFIFIFMLGL